MKLLFLALFAAAALLARLSAEQCGRQAGGTLCPGGLCCSQWGYCGSTDPYCGDGCQSQCSRSGGGQAALLVGLSAEQCGRQAGGTLCPGGLCCSQWGYCGSTDPYCGDGCQSQCGRSGGGQDALLVGLSAEQCGRQAGGTLCSGGLCCSQWGYCGNTDAYCGPGCQSQCGSSGGDVASVITQCLFDQMLKHRNNTACQGRGFYTYDAFIAAAKSFPLFGTTGGVDIRKREIAAFLAQTSHETNGTDPVVSFKTALWFWMTPQSPKPSCHDVITGQWMPSATDQAALRLPGYGVVTNIINGGAECGRGPVSQVADRIWFYKRYCDLLGVSYGDNLDCDSQRPFGSGSRLSMVVQN